MFNTKWKSIGFNISSEFSTICKDAFEEKVIEIGLRDNNLFTSLRPHIFDSFKYNKSFNSNQKIYFNFLSTRKMVSFKTDWRTWSVLFNNTVFKLKVKSY
jgi:hypothetical protein